MSPRQKEATLTNKIRKAIQETYPDSWDMKVLGGNFHAGGRRMSQRPGIPDLIVLVEGQMFGLEVKRPGGKPTPKQEHEMRLIRRAGGHALVVQTIEDALKFIGEVLTRGR